MKFEIGDSTDHKLVRVISHEFSRAKDAFMLFQYFSIEYFKAEEKNKKSISDSVKIHIYDSYSDFLKHLYEQFVACFKRDNRSTADIKYDRLDFLINWEVKKYNNRMISLFNAGLDGQFGLNDKSYYEESVPNDFGKKLREMRNMHSHSDTRRIDGNRLANFYRDYHKYALALYYTSLDHWDIRETTHRDWKDIESFADLIFDQENENLS
ncbi:hypothetical protein ACE5IS_19495 [Leptospira wolffii]|uniref:RiboL-PSP-HEPN domain-containing protein n=1 Tax=Leptospira wolffii TaxID=409998 RepID=A0ABV5BUB1_9LEPT